ncbi:MAG: hypothetical protein ACK55D_16880, partial [Synechococcaceae cyanobacterium]
MDKPATLETLLTAERSARFKVFIIIDIGIFARKQIHGAKVGQSTSLYRHAEATKSYHFVSMAHERSKNISSSSGTINKAVGCLRVSALQEGAS